MFPQEFGVGVEYYHIDRSAFNRYIHLRRLRWIRENDFANIQPCACIIYVGICIIVSGAKNRTALYTRVEYQ